MPILQYYCDIHCSSFILDSNCLRESAQVKMATKLAQKLLSECLRNTLRELKFPNFFGAACPQTPLGVLWAYAHSITFVTVRIQRSEPPTFTMGSLPLHGYMYMCTCGYVCKLP